MDKKVEEARKVAEYSYLLNETNWYKFEDEFFIINKRWFDRWKEFVSYDYVVSMLVEKGKKPSDLSRNKVMSCNAYPGEISNSQLILDRKDFHPNRNENMAYLNSPLKAGLRPGFDYIFVPGSIWRFLNSRYKGERIKRYAIHMNQTGILRRDPELPKLLVCLIMRDEAIRLPKWVVVPSKSTFLDIKMCIRETF